MNYFMMLWLQAGLWMKQHLNAKVLFWWYHLYLYKIFIKTGVSSVFHVSKCLQVCKFLIRAEMPWNDTDNLIITYFALLYCVTITFTDQFLMFQPCHSSLSMSPLCTSPPPPPAPPCRPSRRTPPLSELTSQGKLLNPLVPNNNKIMLLLQEKTEKSKVSSQWSRKQRNWIFGQKLWRLQRRLWLRVRGWHQGYQWTCQSRN